MKTSNFKFGLNNYRVFNKRQDFEFAPITMLVGPNNSGKSSIMKSLFVLKESMIDQNIPLELNFDWIENQMSSFDDLASNLDEPLVYIFNIESPFLGKGVIKLFYSADYGGGIIQSKNVDPYLKSVKIEFKNSNLLEFEFDRHNIFNLKFNLKFFLDSINDKLDAISKMLDSYDIKKIIEYHYLGDSKLARFPIKTLAFNFFASASNCCLIFSFLASLSRSTWFSAKALKYSATEFTSNCPFPKNLCP